MLSFDNLISAARLAIVFDHLGPDDEVLAYLPMAWIGDHFFSFTQAIIAGFVVDCPERDRSQLLFCPATGAREHPDAGYDPDRRRRVRQALDVPPFYANRATLRHFDSPR
jgi:hypothetical protein